jgi:hypothetical protein
MSRTAEAILGDTAGRRSVSFQEAVRAIAELVDPDRIEELGDLATKSPNEVRRRFDALLVEHPVGRGSEEAVLQVAWAYGERSFVRSLARQVSPASRARAESWARARIRERKAQRGKEREAGAPFDSRPRGLGGDVPDSEVRIVHAAIRLFDGTVLGTPDDGTHPDVVESLDPAVRAGLEGRIESEGFVDAHGNYLDRGEASIVTGVAGESTEVAGTVQGTPLRRVQERSLETGPRPDGLEIDDEEAHDAVAFLDQFRTDRSL